MPTFTIADEDLEDLIRRDIWQALRRDGTRPAGAVAVGVVLVPLSLIAAAAAFGMALAWGITLFEIVRRGASLLFLTPRFESRSTHCQFS